MKSISISCSSMNIPKREEENKSLKRQKEIMRNYKWRSSSLYIQRKYGFTGHFSGSLFKGHKHRTYGVMEYEKYTMTSEVIV